MNTIYKNQKNSSNGSEKFVRGLLKSGEEGAELAQAVIKSIVHADEVEFIEGNEFFEKLVEEFGDAVAAMEVCLEYAPPIFTERVYKRAEFKVEQYYKVFENSEAY